MITKEQLAKHLDLANHHANSTDQDIEKLCNEVLEYGFHSAFVNPCYVELANKIIKNSASVGTVISFPLGQDIELLKISSCKYSILCGANELDVSINVGDIKQQKFEKLFNDMSYIVSEAKAQNSETLVKFIIETGYLSDSEIMKASELVVASGADFVKTCSGYGPRGATIKDVKLIKQAIGNQAKIKVAGGITTLAQALEFIKEGAARIGTSHAVVIMQEFISVEG